MALDIFRRLLGLRPIDAPGGGTVECMCTENCAVTFGGHCRMQFDAIHQAVLDQRDAALARGVKVPALELVGPDRRGLPKYRLRGNAHAA